jgi:biopolymer transport protein ExbD
MRIRHTDRRDRPGRLEMSSMIDIVFLLLVFFVMTFTITAMEGDFHVEAAPLSKQRSNLETRVEALPLQLRLTADADGKLAAIHCNDRRFADFDQLHRFVLDLAAERTGYVAPLDDFTVDLDCDPQLDYRHTIDAITAVTGHLQGDGKRIELIRQVRFR